jgi:predicted nuclease of predicted toxin-antitoxin system
VTSLAQGLKGAQDRILLARCIDEGRAIVTLDLDFADIRAYPPEGLPGVMVLRLGHQDRKAVLGVLQRSLPLLSQEGLAGRLWIIEEERVRIRGGEENA